jgi:RiboL-PSP-HEPN
VFTSIVDDLRREIEGVTQVVLWQESLRDLVHPPGGGSSSTLAITPEDVIRLRGSAPTKLHWQVFDHCAAMSRIYGIYEAGLISLLSRYLAFIPRVYPHYSNLSEAMRNQYRNGVGQILLKWSADGGKYSHVPETDISSGLTDGLRGSAYSLLNDAFLVDPENYRSGALIRFFSGIGFANCFAWLSKDVKILEFLTTRLGNSNTPEGFLDDFVKTRNEAAHGAVSSLASSTILVSYADYIVLIIESLAALLRSHLIREGISNSCAVEIGRIVHKFSDNIGGVVSSGTHSVRVEDKVYIGKKRLNLATISSLRVLTVSHESLSLSPQMECGMQFDIEFSADDRIYRWLV